MLDFNVSPKLYFDYPPEVLQSDREVYQKPQTYQIKMFPPANAKIDTIWSFFWIFCASNVLKYRFRLQFGLLAVVLANNRGIRAFSDLSNGPRTSRVWHTSVFWLSGWWSPAETESGSDQPQVQVIRAAEPDEQSESMQLEEAANTTEATQMTQRELRKG